MIILLATLVVSSINKTKAGDDDYNILQRDGSYEFGYNNPDSYHYAQANRNNIVKGEFGGRNPKTGGIDTTVYTAGPRGFRPRGKNVVRKYDLNQAGPRPVGSRYDPYYDPYEDPSYNFSFRTRTYNRDENANRVGDVTGRYSYTDDVGERHNVEFIAGKNTGFHVKTPFPDSNPRAYGPLYFRGRGRPIPRGRTSIQRGLDGSYKFVSAGPDQRRTETSDATGHVRGSYTYLDDKGVQHSVHYIAGPETGYRVLKTVKGPHLPTVFPFNHPEVLPPDFYDFNDKDVFDTAATGHARPGGKPGAKPTGSNAPGSKDEDNGLGEDDGGDFDKNTKPGGDDFSNKAKPGGSTPSQGDDFDFGGKKPGAGKPSKSPYDEDDSGYDTDFGDLFGDGGGGGGKGNTDGKGSGSGSGTQNKPVDGVSKEGSYGSHDDGSYKPNNEYIPPKDEKSGDAPGEDYGNKDGFGLPSSEGGNKPSSSRPSPGGSKPTGSSPGTFSNDDDDFGLFGSESNRPRPPYNADGINTGPVITIGGPNKNCPKCQGAILTNVGDTYLSVPPGVSVRAHVQAIDLLPYSSRFPGPSDQYKADVTLSTEQLNSEKDKIVSKIEDTTEEVEDDTTTEETTTEIEITTFTPNSTKSL